MGLGIYDLPAGLPAIAVAAVAGLIALGLLVYAARPRRAPPTPTEGAAESTDGVPLELADRDEPPAPLSRRDEPYDIFVSYARRDNRPPHGHPHWVEAFVWRLNRARRAVGRVADFNVFYDVEQIELMNDWRDKIRLGVRQSAVLAALVSPRSLASEVCGEEWAQFRDREVELGLGRAAVLPVVLEPLPVTSRSSKAEILDWLASLPDDVPTPGGDLDAVADDIRARLEDFEARQGILRELQAPFRQSWRTVAADPSLETPFRTIAQRIEETLMSAQRSTGEYYDPFFVGRRAQLDELRQTLTQGSGAIAVIQSLGGMGKTALARRYAQENQQRYRGGVFILNCEGVGALDIALRTVAVELDVATDVPPDAVVAAVVKGLHKRCADGSECLLVFDNVSAPELITETTLQPLRAPAWLHVLITSRLEANALGAGIPGRTIIELGELPEADAVELIRLRQPNRAFASAEDEEAAHGIARALGGFTLAVEAAAVTLARADAGFTVAGFLRRLSRDLAGVVEAVTSDRSTQAVVHHQDHMLSATLGPTVDQLAPLERHALRFASLWPPDLILEPWLRAVAAPRHPELADDPPPGEGLSAWAAVRNRLIGLQLLLPVGDVTDRTPRVFRMHRLVGAYVLRTWDDNDQQAARTAVLAWIHDHALRLDTQRNRAPTEVGWQSNALATVAEHIRGWAQPGAAVRQIGLIQNVAGSLEARFGSFARGIALSEESVVTRRAIRDAHPDDLQAARELSVSLGGLGDLLLQRGGPKDAERAQQHYEEDLAITEALHQAAPKNIQIAHDLALSLHNLADFYLRRGAPDDTERALNRYERAQAIVEALHAAVPENAEVARAVFVNLNKLADFYLRRGAPGDIDLALERYEAANAIARTLRRADPDDAQAARDLAVNLNRLGDFYFRRGGAEDTERARESYEEAYAISRAQQAASPDDAQAARDVATNLERLGDFYRQLGTDIGAERALERYEEATAIRQDLFETRPDDADIARSLSVSLNRLGDHYLRSGTADDTERALQHFERAKDIRQALYDANPGDAQVARDLAVSLTKLGDFHRARGRLADAERTLEVYERARDITQALFDANPGDGQAARDLAVSLEKVGDAYLRRGGPGDADRALRGYARAHDIAQALYDASPGDALVARDLATSLQRLADFYTRRGEPDDAARALEINARARALRQARYDANPDDAGAARDLAVSLEKLARLHHKLGQQEPAVEYTREALELRERLMQADPDTASALDFSRIAFLAFGLLARTDREEAARRFADGYTVLKGLHAANALVNPQDLAFFEKVERLARSMRGDA